MEKNANKERSLDVSGDAEKSKHTCTTRYHGTCRPVQSWRKQVLTQERQGTAQFP